MLQRAIVEVARDHAACGVRPACTAACAGKRSSLRAELHNRRRSPCARVACASASCPLDRRNSRCQCHSGRHYDPAGRRVAGALRRHMWDQSRLFTAFGLLAVGVAGVGDDVQPLEFERLPCSLGHRLQLTVVAGLQHDGMGHEERAPHPPLSAGYTAVRPCRPSSSDRLLARDAALASPTPPAPPMDRWPPAALRRPSRSCSYAAPAPRRSRTLLLLATARNLVPSMAIHSRRSTRSLARTGPVPLLPPSPPRGGSAGIRRSTYGPDTVVPGGASQY